MELIERRVAWLSVSTAILIAFDATGVGLAFGGIGTWELVVHVGGLLCLGGAAVLLVASVAPDSVRRSEVHERERFVFLAFALVALAMVAIVGLSSHFAIEAHRHPARFG